MESIEHYLQEKVIGFMKDKSGGKIVAKLLLLEQKIILI